MGNHNSGFEWDGQPQPQSQPRFLPIYIIYHFHCHFYYRPTAHHTGTWALDVMEAAPLNAVFSFKQPQSAKKIKGQRTKDKGPCTDTAAPIMGVPFVGGVLVS